MFWGLLLAGVILLLDSMVRDGAFDSKEDQERRRNKNSLYGNYTDAELEEVRRQHRLEDRDDAMVD